MTSRPRGRAPWVLVAAASLATALAGCAASTPAESAGSTLISTSGCSSEPTSTQLREQIRLIPDSGIVSGVLKPTGVTEKVNLQGGGWQVVTQNQLTVTEVIAGKLSLPATATVWTTGGRAGGWELQVEPQVFTDKSGAGVFIVTPANLSDRLVAIIGLPLTDGSVVLGYGCSNTKGFAKTAPVKTNGAAAYDLDISTNRLAPTSDTPTDGTAQVSLTDFKSAIKTG